MIWVSALRLFFSRNLLDRADKKILLTHPVNRGEDYRSSCGCSAVIWRRTPVAPVAMVADGFAKGVPMRGDLAMTTAPSFTVYAAKDPMGANLDRIQIIKGWVDPAGTTHERIIDAVWSGDHAPDAAGALPAVGDTVDLTTGLCTNNVGAPTLIGSWTDPMFDPAERAFYCARALAIPTLRWTTCGAVRNGLPLLPQVAATVQERA
jgi:hypothetical protein